ncbi:MAG: SHOCT domain-containing protein, partial [Mycobacterium sp.]|nr:SHOCT domain-containing protein [Mycobacterium sp.]
MMVVGGVGFMATQMLNSFVLDKYAAYGEVPIPGSATLHLPAGEVEVSLHVRVISSPRGNGLPIPRLGLTVVPPTGVADPTVTESFGSTTTVNNDTHRRVWLMQVPVEGDYQIKTDGQIGGYISPKLAFGTATARNSLVWAFVAVFGVGLLDLICATWWSRRLRRRPQRVAPKTP